MLYWPGRGGGLPAACPQLRCAETHFHFEINGSGSNSCLRAFAEGS